MQAQMRDDVRAATEQDNTADRPSVREITLAIEFLTMGLRALADGHPVDSHMVRDPLLFAFSKVRDMTGPYLRALA
jgi:hypothetical protein